MKVLMIGEIRIGDGCIHQADLAACMDAELITAFPKKNEAGEPVTVVLGKLMKDKPTSNLQRAEKSGLKIVPVATVLTSEVNKRIVALLTAKPKREKYEQTALDHLSVAEPHAQPAADPTPERPKDGTKKKVRGQKAAANG